MDLQTAAPERLIERLLQRAVQLVETSAATIDNAPSETPVSIAKAIDIVSELRSALDMEAGGEISRNLDALYEFATERLLLGHAARDEAMLREAALVLGNVAATWSELVRQRESKP
jgi:flagellar protein FliS